MYALYRKQFNKKLINFLVFVLMLSVSLFDLYYYKIGRIFDYLAFLILSFLFSYLYILNKINLYRSLYDLRFKLLIFVYFFIPYFIKSDLRLSLGIAFFLLSILLILIITNNYPKIVDIIVRYSPIILCIHLFFFYSQYFLFKYFNIYLDFTHLLLSHPSRNSHLFEGLFRPSGLFHEPNSFCLFTIIFLVIISCQNFNKINKFVLFLSLFAILISNSVWAYLGFAIILFGLLVEKKFKFFFILFLIFTFTQNFWLLDNTKIRINETKNDILNVLKFKQILNSKKNTTESQISNNKKSKKVFQDPSGNERLFRVEVKEKISDEKTSYNYDPIKIQNLKSKCQETFYNLFGCGYNNFGYQFIHGINAFSFLKVNLGLFGLIYFIFGIFLILKEKSIYNFVFILFIFTTAPIFTYSILHLFIGVMFNKKIFNKSISI